MKTELIHGDGYVRVELTAENDFERLTLSAIQDQPHWETVKISEDSNAIWAPPVISNTAKPCCSQVRLVHVFKKKS